MKTFRKNLGITLKKMRGKQSQREFADKLGISHATLNRIEQGTQNTTIDTLQQISSKLKIRIGDMIDS